MDWLDEAAKEARLLRAANDLLVASIVALKVLREFGFTDELEAVVLLKEAIAKAEGQWD